MVTEGLQKNQKKKKKKKKNKGTSVWTSDELIGGNPHEFRGVFINLVRGEKDIKISAGGQSAESMEIMQI